ncbi:Brp/Blh family beta-carotene 15,15'-dioxygenase [Halonotius roseus]|uniref:Probable beta-carotene 15,15'-dioxygenase n=1 Tax=Halonotius roseus TaxID=2511997 RepID=A0A544QP11_9EURY|nr:Brp/Blh family beta-carotene 15,15'-dioxygenase [Halonotius roseus]TQQ80667.1 beta-carotene 15,15'-dioxygenase [Halonotius roseus]
MDTWSRETTVGRLTMTLPLVVIALAIPFGVVIDDLPQAVRFAPFVVSVGLFGLPHGAVDHLMPLRLGNVPLKRSLAVVGVVYAILGGLYLAVWALSPAVALLAFLGMTWFHWGQGDAFALRAFGGGDHIRTRSDRWASLVVRGGLPMLVPLLGQPEGYQRVVNGIIELFDPASTTALSPLFRVDTRLALGIGFGVFTLSSLLWTARHVWKADTSAGGLAWDAVEIGLLWLFFWLVPPVFAVGLYFAVWHSVRHIGRLAIVDPAARQALDSGEWPTALGRFYRDAAPLTVASLALFAGLYVWVPTDGSLNALLAIYLVGIAVLTLPHVAVVTWMDQVQYEKSRITDRQ